MGAKAAAWFWFDLAAGKETKAGKDFFANSRKELFQLLTIGSTTDAARRSDFLAAGLYITPDGYKFSLRMPAKRDGLDEVMRVHVPASGIATKPLLEPEGVVLSQSFYLDLGHLWKNRKTIIADETQLKDLEKGVEQASKFLPGTSLGTLLEQSGPYHRIVMARTGEKLYKKEPGQVIPPTAYIGSMRDSAYGKSMDGLLRAAGLLASFPTGWKISEAKHDGVNIVTYRFPENAVLSNSDSNDLRFNAAPSFAVVNDSLVVGSTPGIVKAVIPLLKKESEAAGSSEVWKFKFYAAGAGEVIAENPDVSVTQAVLSQGITLAEARTTSAQLRRVVPQTRFRIHQHRAWRRVLPSRCRVELSKIIRAVIMNAWAPYTPSESNPWDLKKVGHLYRRAAFGATHDEMQRALKDGPEKTIDRLLAGWPGQRGIRKNLRIHGLRTQSTRRHADATVGGLVALPPAAFAASAARKTCPLLA